MAKNNNKSDPGATFPHSQEFERYVPYIVAGLTVIGLLIRFYRVHYLSLWVDEYVHVTRAMDFLHGGPLFRGDNNGIFLTILLIPCYLIFGISDFISRLPSVILGALTIPSIYYLAKKLFNIYVGLFSAVLATVSLYSVFWSRLCRNYASFEFSYTLLLLVFILAFEVHHQMKKTAPGFAERHDLNLKYLLLLPLVFVFSLLNHQLTFFFFFSFGAYASIVALSKIIKKEPDRFTNKYAIVLYPTSVIAVLFFTPFLGNIIRPLLSMFLPDGVVTWVLPNWGYILSKWSSPEKYKIFSMYAGVLRNDYTLLYILGIAGIILAFLLNRKSAVFLSAFFIVPLLLMSFIFRDPSLPRYLIFIYPLFLISIAVSIFWVINDLLPKALPENILKKELARHGIMPLVLCLMIISSPLAEVWGLVSAEKHGQVIKNELSVWHFTNWKESCQIVKDDIQPDDVVISTMPTATNYYLSRDNSIWFRQQHFDTGLRKYVSNAPKNTPGESAWTHEEFIETVNRNKRGWLIVDYYFYNVMTDPRSREYAIQNLKYYFDGSRDGSVQVFVWDHDFSEPKKRFILELGKKGNTLSQPLTITLPSIEQAKEIRILVDAEGIDSNNEAFIITNMKTRTFLQKCRTTGREIIPLVLDKRGLKTGRNVIQFGYNSNNPLDTRKGYALYNLMLEIE